MKSFNVDWHAVVGLLDVWEKLSDDGRRSYVQLKANKYVPWPYFQDRDRELLFSRRLISPNHDDSRVKVGHSAGEFSKVMRALARSRFNPTSDARALASYTSDHFTNYERNALLGRHGRHTFYSSPGPEAYQAVTREAWVREFLDLKDAAAAVKWELARLPDQVSSRFEDGSPYFRDESLFQATRALVESALTWPGPVPIAALPNHIKGPSASRVWWAILPAVRYLLLFPWLKGESMTPVIGVWPQISYLVHRPRSKPPQPVEPVRTFHAPLLPQDMTMALVTASAEPIRLLANGDGFYARDMEQLAKVMTPTPDWLAPKGDPRDGSRHGLVFMDIDFRIHAAVRQCHEQKLLETRETKRRRRLEVTDAGRQWLALDVKQQVRDLIRPWRDKAKPAKPGKARKHSSRSPLTMLMGSGFVVDYDEMENLDDLPWMPSDLRWMIDDEVARQIDWRAAFVDLLTGEADQHFVPVAELLEHHSRVNNPLLGRRHEGSYGPTPQFRGYRQHVDELELERRWFNAAARMLDCALLPLGAIELGWDGKESHAVRLHSIGRYMLGLTDDFDYQVRPEGDIIIGSNFEITFLGPSPHAEAILGRLAQRIGQSVGTVFRLTKASILAAAAAGITADQALQDLREVSSRPLPDNVEREVRGWFKFTRHAHLRQAWIIEAPDEGAADRIRAAAGKSAKSLTPTLVEIGSRKDHAALIRKLKQTGIFIRK